jgi:hypothetical protein
MIQWLRELFCFHSWTNRYEGAPFVSARVWTCSSCGKRIRHEPLPIPSAPPRGFGRLPEITGPTPKAPPVQFPRISLEAICGGEDPEVWLRGRQLELELELANIGRILEDYLREKGPRT